MSSTSPHKRAKFTKKPGKAPSRPRDYRLTLQEQQIFRKLVRGPKGSQARMEAWAHALSTTLVGDEIIDTKDHKQWLEYRLRKGRGMLLRDAARVMVAGMRTRDPRLDSNYEWQMSLAEYLPVISRFHHGYGVLGRFDGIYDGPFEPIMMPRSYIGKLADELSKVAMPRDKGGRRHALGARIEAFLVAKYSASPPETPWNSSASFAIETISLQVLFREYYRGRFGKYSSSLDTAINEAGYAISHFFERMLADEKPEAFERLSKRLATEIDEARNMYEATRNSEADERH